MKILYFHLLIFTATALLESCVSQKSASMLPKSIGERNSAYSYVPIDPLPVFTGHGKSCIDDKMPFKKLLESFPDQAVRLAVGEFDASGSLSFGPVSTGFESHSYQVILDYISVDVAQIPVFIKKVPINETQSRESLFNSNAIEVNAKINTDKQRYKYKVWPAPRFGSSGNSEYFDTLSYSKGDLVVMPLYIGVGLRLTATVTVIKGQVNLSSLGAIAAEAKAGKLTGSLVVQTLGITGKNVAASLPLPSEINETTIQNAILALGSIKAVLYDEENTLVTPRVVGLYNPIGGGQEVINGVISVLAEDPITWHRPCEGDSKK